MTDWTTPEKNPDTGTWWTDSGYGPNAMLSDGEIMVDGHVSRDDVLRLLAAEASDRLGLEWMPFRSIPTQPLHMHSRVCDWWFDDGTSGPGTPVESAPAFRCHVFKTENYGSERTPDEMLAALHGKFLLEAAMKTDDAKKASPAP